MNLPKLDARNRGILVAVLCLAVLLGCAKVVTSFPGSPAAVASSAACATEAQIAKAKADVDAATAAVQAAASSTASVAQSLSAAQKAKQTSRVRSLQSDLTRAKARLAAAELRLKMLTANHGRHLGRRCRGGAAATTTPVASVDVRFVSADETRANGENPGDADSVELRVRFSVTAQGGDVFVDGDTLKTGAPSASKDGLAWSYVAGSANGTTVAEALTASDGYRSWDTNTSGDKRFKILNGATRSFTLSVLAEAAGDNASAGLQMNALKWDTVSRDAMTNLQPLDADTFRTDVETGLMVR